MTEKASKRTAPLAPKTGRFAWPGVGLGGSPQPPTASPKVPGGGRGGLLQTVRRRAKMISKS